MNSYTEISAKYDDFIYLWVISKEVLIFSTQHSVREWKCVATIKLIIKSNSNICHFERQDKRIQWQTFHFHTILFSFFLFFFVQRLLCELIIQLWICARVKGIRYREQNAHNVIPCIRAQMLLYQSKICWQTTIWVPKAIRQIWFLVRVIFANDPY